MSATLYWTSLVAKSAYIMAFPLTLAFLLAWAERKQSAVMQDRIGANRAKIFGRPFLGLVHMICDAVKMFTKEDFVPDSQHRLLHTVAPALAMFFALLSFAVIPFGYQLTILGETIGLHVVDLNVGVLFVFAMVSLGVYGVVLGGWSSNNNYALLGGMRASAQMISYEICIGMTIIGAILAFGTLSMQELVLGQGDLLFGWLPKWGVVLQPLGFLLFFTAGIAETKRVPFDMPEGESEIIGFNLEYSSMKFGMFLFTDFVETVLIAAVTVTFFFGGWQIPYLADSGFAFPWGGTWEMHANVVNLLRMGAFAFKVVFFCWLMMAIRWTLPRFRYDQLMDLGWKWLLPLSLVNVVITALVVLIIA
jgi:NADH-quinone oxidoreductase subunit H